MADGYLHADDTYIAVLCAWYECCTSVVQGAILRTKTALGYRQSHAAPIAFADLPRLDFALHFALTGVERERDAPCSTLAHESLRMSAPHSSYHYTQRLHITRILTHVMSMDASNGMTCVRYFMSASTKCCICSCRPHARMESNGKRPSPSRANTINVDTRK